MALGQKLEFKTFGVRLVQLVQLVQIVFSLRKKLQLSTMPLGQSYAKQEGCWLQGQGRSFGCERDDNHGDHDGDHLGDDYG